MPRNSYIAGLSVSQSTADNTPGRTLGGSAVSKVGAQVVVAGTGLGTFKVQGCIDAAKDVWIDLIGSSTYTGATSRIVASTGNFVVSNIRAMLLTHGSTKKVNIYVVGV